MNPFTPRFILLGGFLGAGKTTAIGRLARHYASRGLKVAIVTNDQTTDLVDTHSLRSQGFQVGEVAGACFCCHFNDLTATVDRLSADGVPDLILAEPVGSCTDLVATVIRPLARVYARPLSIAPYGVILKPSHGAKILRHQSDAGFSSSAAYIFRKQLEEADFLILNRIDELSAGEARELAALLAAEFPGRPVLKVSAKTGEGFAALAELLDRAAPTGQRPMDVDYDVYAEGEAELGWLNSRMTVAAPRPFVLDGLLLECIGRLRAQFAAAGMETAHLKIIGQTETDFAVANLVSSFTEPELSVPSHASATAAELVVNARVAIDPKALGRLVSETVEAAATAVGATLQIGALQSFRPGRPVPTHRIVQGVS